MISDSFALNYANRGMDGIYYNGGSWMRIEICGYATGAHHGWKGAKMAVAQPAQGSIVGWGSQVIGVDLSQGFVAVVAGRYHSLGLKSDGSVVAWGDNKYGQTNLPAPNADFPPSPADAHTVPHSGLGKGPGRQPLHLRQGHADR